MKSFTTLLNNFSTLDSILEQALQNTSQYLSRFIFDAKYTQKLETAFGNDFDAKKANQLFGDFAKGKFKAVPTIEIVNRNDINGANGAFSITTGKIYLAADFISQNANNVDAVVAVLLEEIGHFIDSQINTADTAGDEGDVFARVVQGDSLSEQELAVLRAENDHATVTLDGEVVEIEMNGPGSQPHGTNVSWTGGWWTNGTISGTIHGTNNADWIGGREKNDTIYGYGGNDWLKGEENDDVIYGGANNDTIEGGSGNDTLYGQDGNDTIYGGNDNDKIYATGTGGDFIDGNGGYDEYYLDQSGAVRATIEEVRVYSHFHGRSSLPNNIYYATRYYADGRSDRDQLTAVETFFGTNGDDNLSSMKQDRWLFGQRTYLYGRGGNDNLTAEDNNQLEIHLLGEDGDDLLSAIASKERARYLYGGLGIDTFQIATTEQEQTTFQDQYNSQSSQWTSFGVNLGVSLGSQLLDTFQEKQFLKKIIKPENLGKLVSGLPFVGIAVDAIFGILDIIAGFEKPPSGATNNVVRIYDFKLGEDFLILPTLKGDDLERYELAESNGGVTITGHYNNRETRDIAWIKNNENLGNHKTHSSFTALLNDILNDRGVKDTIRNPMQNEMITSNGKTVNTGSFIISPELELWANSNGGELEGFDSHDTMKGQEKNDILWGNKGNDRLIGGKSAGDHNNPEPGIDVLIGGEGVDTADYSESPNGIQANLATISTVSNNFKLQGFSFGTVNNDGYGTKDYLHGVEGIVGSNHNDTITGDSNRNQLIGNGGNDTLDGGAEADLLIGGAGNDIYIVDNTNDVIGENENEGIDSVQSSVTFSLDDNIENLTLTGTSAINGTGNAGNNVITGNANNNILNGNTGNDTLIGGLGKDALTGGLGTDRFDYRNLADSLLNNFDVITDFNANANQDKLVVSNQLSGFFLATWVTSLDANSIGRILTSTNFQANAAARFQLLSFGKNMRTRTFVAINDGIAGFDANTDAIIEVTGLTGVLGINNFTTTLA